MTLSIWKKIFNFGTTFGIIPLNFRFNKHGGRTYYKRPLFILSRTMHQTHCAKPCNTENADIVKQVWYQDGKLHREDGPAIIYTGGRQEWYLNGKLHREDGPAYIRTDGAKQWWINGKRHREDGPAITRLDGMKFWYLNGRKHREDGPAVIRPNGRKEWYLNGDHCTFENYVNTLYPNDCPEKTMFMMKWS